VTDQLVTTRGLGENDPWADVDPGRPGLLPDAFWKARPVFGHIRRAAHSRVCSGDVLFWACMARESGMIPHYIRADTGIGNPASLNIFAAPVGPSGAGKTTSASLAPEIMPAPKGSDFLDGLPIGTGEGMAEILMGTVEEPTGGLIEKGPRRGEPVMQKVRKQVLHNAYFYIDEGETLTSLSERNATTLFQTIRSAAVGQVLGQSNASEDRRRLIRAGTYSMGMIVGFQPSTALPLLADTGTGTPQRFFWSWVEDPSIPDDPPEWPGIITNHPGYRWRDLKEPLNIDFPQDIKDALRRAMIDRNRGTVQIAEIDAHANLMKVKLAAMFALLDEREKVTEEDWDLGAWVGNRQAAG
jgi:hypothetical protein